MDVDIEDELEELRRLAGRATTPEIAAESTTTS
jgi:hypothetical protein